MIKTDFIISIFFFLSFKELSYDSPAVIHSSNLSVMAWQALQLLFILHIYFALLQPTLHSLNPIPYDVFHVLVCLPFFYFLYLLIGIFYCSFTIKLQLLIQCTLANVYPLEIFTLLYIVL